MTSTRSKARRLPTAPRLLGAGRPMTFRGLTRICVVALLGSLLAIPVWSNPAQAADRGQYILGGTDWPPGHWTSQNGVYRLTMQQDDGNLVLYRRANGHVVPVWASNTQGTGSFLSMRNNGMLEVWGNRTVTWSSKRSFPIGGPAFLKVQDDGKLVVYRGVPNGYATAYFWNARWDQSARPNLPFFSVSDLLAGASDVE
jgi:hypothetical protein